jgi:hypothetical protein
MEHKQIFVNNGLDVLEVDERIMILSCPAVPGYVFQENGKPFMVLILRI